MFSLSPSDRTFVFSLIDKLAEYEEANPGGSPMEEAE
jgi:hypothetical protein